MWDGRLTRRGGDAPDLTAPAPQVAGEMRERLIGLMERYRLTDSESRSAVSEAELKQLEALGYVDRTSQE